MPLEIDWFKNSPVPVSIFIDYGSLMSTKKSDELEKIESFINTENYSLTSSIVVDCFLYDVMAVVKVFQPRT